MKLRLPEAVAGTAEAELENAQEVLEEAEQERAGEAEDDQAVTNAEGEAEEQSLTAAELAVENVPEADERNFEVDSDEEETGSEDDGGVAARIPAFQGIMEFPAVVTQTAANAKR